MSRHTPDCNEKKITMIGDMSETNGEAGKKTEAIDRKIQDHLGTRLREAYRQTIQEPIPDRFIRLLEELSREEGASRKEDNGEET
ncbi:MAG: NepR family anti-sigma factor [Hyphomicrobiaceae bacterium]